MRQRTVEQYGNEATGFSGPVRSMSALTERVGAAAPALRLPNLDGALPPADGGPWSAIEVHALTESMGPVEAAMLRFATALAPDGTLLLDVENEQSLRRLRLCIDGAPGSFDPAGSLLDPSQALPLRRVLQAADAAGLFVHDVVRVPNPAQELRPGFAPALFAHGFLPLGWLGGAPPVRFWLALRKCASLAGSVLIGPGDANAQAASEACVRAFLPADWEVLRADVGAGAGASEGAAWNAAIARARGETIWFLRAGATASAALFGELSLAALVGPAAPRGEQGERACPGDVSGLMLARRDVLLAGPLPVPANSRVALEEYCMQLDACLPQTQLVECRSRTGGGQFASPLPPIESPATFAKETAGLLQRWSPMGPQQAAVAAPAAAPLATEPDTAPPPWAGREPRVTLCMIARDEERFLPECLRRALPAVDEIVLVDTGSTDRTVAIAESFGARVLHQPWADDFSAPRNAALAAATGDWILVLDADEFLVGAAAARIRELVRASGVAGWHMRFTNVYTSGKTVGVMMVRLFRNLPGLAWQNVIHEQVTPSLLRAGRELGLELGSCEVEVEHHGYSDEVMQSRGKNERNERLFSKQLAQTPDDVYCLYKYGDFLRRVPGRSDDAHRLLLRCLEVIRSGPPSLPRELPYAGEVAALCALELARRNETAAAVAVVDEALRRFIATPNLHYIAASLMLAQSRADAAIAHFRRCLAYRGQVLVVPIQDGITAHVSLLGIAQALALKGELQRASRLAERAVAMAPDYEVGPMVLSKLQLRLGDPAEALRTLTAFLTVRPDSPGVCQQATLILQRIGCVDQARRMGNRALALLQRNGADREAAHMQEILAAM